MRHSNWTGDQRPATPSIAVCSTSIPHPSFSHLEIPASWTIVELPWIVPAILCYIRIVVTRITAYRAGESEQGARRLVAPCTRWHANDTGSLDSILTSIIGFDHHKVRQWILHSVYSQLTTRCDGHPTAGHLHAPSPPMSRPTKPQALHMSPSTQQSQPPDAFVTQAWRRRQITGMERTRSSHPVPSFQEAGRICGVTSHY